MCNAADDGFTWGEGVGTCETCKNCRAPWMRGRGTCSFHDPQPAPAPLPEADAPTIIGYDFASGPDQTAILINGHSLTEDDRAMLLRLLCAGPAPLPEEVKEAEAVLSRVQAVLREADLLFAAESLRIPFGVLREQARRLAELEMERGSAEEKATRVCQSILRIGKRLRIARNRVRGIGEELLCARERVGCPASVLSQLCDMRKALGLDLIKTSYTEILPAIQDVVIRAESAESSRDGYKARCEALERALAAIYPMAEAHAAAYMGRYHVALSHQESLDLAKAALATEVE